MEFIDGMDLDRYLDQQKGKEVTYPVLLSIMRDIAYAMEYIHSQNVLHLDLRCANVMVRIYTFSIAISFPSSSFYPILIILLKYNRLIGMGKH